MLAFLQLHGTTLLCCKGVSSAAEGVHGRGSRKGSKLQLTYGACAVEREEFGYRAVKKPVVGDVREQEPVLVYLRSHDVVSSKGLEVEQNR